MRVVLALVLLITCASATSALATTGLGPVYELKVVEGETTLPEYEQIASTSAYVNKSKIQIAVSIIRGGLIVYRDVGEGYAGFSQVPQVGDVLTLESPVGTLIGSVTYDGLPAIDPTVCAGSTNFSGQNTNGFPVKGFFYAEALKTDPYGHFIGLRRTAFGGAQVKTLSGTAFGGNFLVPLSLGETVGASESLETTLPGEATYIYTSENQRPVGGCPPPPVPPPPPPLKGVLKLFHTTIHALLKHGWSDQVTINQPGTVIQDLYLKGGTVPAHASSTHKRHHRTPPALLLARGSAVASAPGTVKVTLKLTAKGRRRLKLARSVKVVLVTTLTNSSGAKLDLGRRSLSLHR